MGSSNFLRDRLGWQTYLKPFLEKPLPGRLNWTFTLGSVLAMLFVVEALSGMLLAMYYNPSPDHAYQSIDFIMFEIFLGNLVRGIHHWGAGAMVVLAVLHMVATFYYGAYKPPRELTWMVGTGLLMLTLAFGFTGYLLPWDQKAYWATVVGTSVPKDIPLIGESIVRLLRGGEEVSGLTLTRFYSVHVLVLPALTLLLIGAHIYLIRVHDIAGHWRPEPGDRRKESRFFPDHIFKSAVVFGIVLVGLIVLSIWVEPPREEIAMTPDPSYLPRPEWYFMWLFELLTYFPGAAEVIGSLVLPAAVILLIFLLPFLSRSSFRRPADRPLAMAVGCTCLVGITYLSFMGIADSRPYGRIIVVPDRKLSALEQRGLDTYVDKDCAYCHRIKGRGGRREGPDLSNVVAKDRTKEWLVKFIKDPRSVSRWSLMPKYELSEEELNALAAFILALDFERYGIKTVSSEEAIQGRNH